MFCNITKRKIPDLIKGELTEKEIEKCFMHIKKCKKCRIDYYETRILLDELKKLKNVFIPKKIEWSKVLSNI